ncbi:hypothetical protein HDU85_007216 [Gaertneriomyces sp. JEL0708]|nr:hypothetical protein HDU85_007216 [Gaertneriomyces sp. JEL0708]
MGVPVNATSPVKINLGHQEVARIIEELEKSYQAVEAAEWIPAKPIGDMLSRELGYEDEAEFEDAIGGTWIELLNVLPNVQTQTDESGKVRFKVLPDPSAEDWVPRRLVLRITDRSQLWNILLKSPTAALEIPEMEFAIQPNGVKKIDSLYNHIGNAIFELGSHVRTVSLSGDHQDKIVDCITSLNDLLDVSAPWTCVVADISGISEFSDMSNVEVRPGMGEDEEGTWNK